MQSGPKNPAAAVSAWNAAQRALATARATVLEASAKASAAEIAPHRPASLGHPTDRERRVRNETRLAYVLARAAELEAEAAEHVARAVAASACDARDVAAGDPQALACDLEILREDLAADCAEADQIRAEIRAEIEAVQARGREKLEAVERRSRSRETAAREAAVALEVKRDLAGEPGPQHAGGLGHEVVRRGAELRALRREEIELRAALEAAHREAEAKAKADAEAARAYEAAKEANRAENTRLHQEWLAKSRAEQAEKDALADAHKARSHA